MPLAVEIEDASSGVAWNGEGDSAGKDCGLVSGGDDVRGKGGRVPVGVVNPDPGIDALGVALGVGDVVSVGEKNVVDPAGIFDCLDEGPRQGWRVGRVMMDCPSPVEVMRSGACWRATSHAMQRSSTYQSPGTFSTWRSARRAIGSSSQPIGQLLQLHVGTTVVPGHPQRR